MRPLCRLWRRKCQSLPRATARSVHDKWSVPWGGQAGEAIFAACLFVMPSLEMETLG